MLRKENAGPVTRPICIDLYVHDGTITNNLGSYIKIDGEINEKK